jgi:hypothetical protein
MTEGFANQCGSPFRGACAASLAGMARFDQREHCHPVNP